MGGHSLFQLRRVGLPRAEGSQRISKSVLHPSPVERVTVPGKCFQRRTVGGHSILQQRRFRFPLAEGLQRISKMFERRSPNIWIFTAIDL